VDEGEPLEQALDVLAMNIRATVVKLQDGGLVAGAYNRPLFGTT